MSTVAVGEPQIAPLADEPIIRTLEAGDREAHKQPAKPEAAKLVAAKPVAAAKPIAAPKAVEPPSDDSETGAITTRRLALYGVVVFSLLGVMVIAIFLILRVGRRTAESERHIATPPSSNLSVPHPPRGPDAMQTELVVPTPGELADRLFAHGGDIGGDIGDPQQPPTFLS